MRIPHHALRPALLGLAAILLAGCTARQRPATNWRFTVRDGAQLLLPPLPPQGRSVVLKNARAGGSGGSGCAVSTPEIDLAWRGRSAVVRVKSSTLAPSGPVTVQGASATLSGTPLVDLSWWERFGEELDKRGAGGCLDTRDGRGLRSRIIENVAMPSNLAYQLRHGNYMMTGYLDLGPEFVLSSVAPLLKPGVARYRTPDDVAGYETVYYDLRPRAGGGLRLSVRGVEQNRGGTVTHARRPLTEVISLPDAARYARYYFRMWSWKGDRKIALLATATPEAMGPLSRRFEANPDAFCASAKSSEAACISVPSQMMIAPELRVRANGKPAYILVGGSIGNVLRNAGIKDPQRVREILPRLQVLRPYNGLLLPVEFDHARPDILSLVPIGGEEVRW